MTPLSFLTSFHLLPLRLRWGIPVEFSHSSECLPWQVHSIPFLFPRKRTRTIQALLEKLQTLGCSESIWEVKFYIIRFILWMKWSQTLRIFDNQGNWKWFWLYNSDDSADGEPIQWNRLSELLLYIRKGSLRNETSFDNTSRVLIRMRKWCENLDCFAKRVEMGKWLTLITWKQQFIVCINLKNSLTLSICNILPGTIIFIYSGVHLAETWLNRTVCFYSLARKGQRTTSVD